MSEVRSYVRVDFAGNINDGLKAVARDAENAAHSVNKLNHAANAGGTGSSGSPSAGQPVYDKTILQAEMARRMNDQQLQAYVEQHKASEDRRRAELEQTRQRQETQNAALKRQASMQSLAVTGLALSGAGGAVGGYGQGMAIGSALEAMGHTRLARFAGPVGMIAGAAQQTAQTAIDYSKATYNPYLTQDQKDRIFAESLPFGKFALNVSSEAYRRRESDMERAGERFQLTQASAERDAMMRENKRDYIERWDIHQGRIDAFRRNQLPVMQTFDRSTASGQWSASEEQIRIRSKRELVKATIEQESAEAKVAATIERQKDIAEEADQLRKKQALWVKQTESGTDDSRKYANDMVGLYDALLQKNKDHYTRGIQSTVLAGRELGAAKTRAGRVQMAANESEIEILQNRIDQGSSSAVRLATMGIGNREINREMFKLVKEIGIENATPEMIAQAGLYAPTTLRQMAEKAGEKLVTDEDRLLAPDDFRFTDKFNEDRAKQDQLKVGNQKIENELGPKEAEYNQMIDVALEKLTGAIIQSVQSQILRIETNIRTAIP